MQQLNQSQNLGGQQLTAALQQVQHLQQEQLRMWADFKRQAQEMQQLLNDKQGVATDRDAARAELLRLQELLQQQKHLQQAYAGKQQELLELEQQQQYLPVSAAGQAGVHAQQHQQQRQHSVEGLWDGQDCLDAFVVKTQLVGACSWQGVLCGGCTCTNSVACTHVLVSVRAVQHGHVSVTVVHVRHQTCHQCMRVLATQV